MPDHLQEIAATTAEAKQVAAQRVAMQDLLDLQGQYGAFAETFLRTPGRTLIDEGLLRRKAYVRLEITADLRLVRLAGPGLAILGATAEVVHGGLPYDVPQTWSKALFEHPSRPDGIVYYARHDDEGLCYAIFDRARGAVREINRTTNLDQDWFWQLARRHRVGLAPG